MRRLILVTLIAVVLAIKNVPLSANDKPGSYLGELQLVKIYDDQILMMLTDHSKFMYVNKIEGQLDMLVQIDKKEKVMSWSSDLSQLHLLEKDRFKTYLFRNKTLTISRPMREIKNVEFNEVRGYKYTREGIYILTDENLLRIPHIASKKQGQFRQVEFIYNKTQVSQGQQEILLDLIQVFMRIDKQIDKKQTQKLPQILALISQISGKNGKQICLKMFQSQKGTKNSCFQVDKSTKYERATFIMDYFYITMSDKTYIVDLGLKVRNEFKKKLVSISSQSVVLEGGSSFIGTKNEISSELSFESQQNKIYKLNSSNNIVSIVLPGGLQKKPIAEFDRENGLIPINAWLNEMKKQGQSDPQQLEVLIQWSNKSLTFINVNKGKAKIIWRIEKLAE